MDEHQRGDKPNLAPSPSNKYLHNSVVKTPSVPYEDIELVAKDKVRLRCYLIPHSPSVRCVWNSILRVLTSWIDTTEGNGHSFSRKRYESWRYCQTPCDHSLDAGIHSINCWISRVNWTSFILKYVSHSIWADMVCPKAHHRNLVFNSMHKPDLTSLPIIQSFRRVQL